MGVDKFGRYTDKDKAKAGPKGEGFLLTSDGDYDMQGKRLCNVKEPSDQADAVNFETHKKSFHNCISLQNGVFDAKNNRISNISEPKDDQDAVNKKYLKSTIPAKLESSYSVHQFRLQDVAPPIDAGDAVNLLHFKSSALVRDSKGVFDAKNTKIQNLAEPVKGNDAVNKFYLDRRLPIVGKEMWTFQNKRIGLVAAPTQKSDAVNLDYLQKNTINLVSTTSEPDEKNKLDREMVWNAGDKRLKRLKKPQGLNDAVNKAYLKESLADLAYSLYKRMKSEGGRASIHDEEDWKREVTRESTSWDDLFNDEIVITPEDRAGIIIENPLK